MVAARARPAVTEPAGLEVVDEELLEALGEVLLQQPADADDEEHDDEQQGEQYQPDQSAPDPQPSPKPISNAYTSVVINGHELGRFPDNNLNLDKLLK